MLLEHDARITLASGDMFAVQKFEKRNGVLAGDTGPVFEVWNGKARAFFLNQHFAQRPNRRNMKHEFIADSNEAFVPNQQLQNVARAVGLDAGARPRGRARSARNTRSQCSSK